MQKSRKLEDYLIERPQPKGMDVLCGLKHFAIITYAVPVDRFQGLFPERFQLDSVEVNGQKMGLISVVPLINVDFTLAAFPFPKFTMGQTDYRIYIVDTETGEHCVWFLGTTLDSWTLAVPRYVWSMPWHAGKIRFDCAINEATGLYVEKKETIINAAKDFKKKVDNKGCDKSCSEAVIEAFRDFFKTL